VAKFLLRTLEFAFYHLLICFVDRLSRLPRDSCPPDAMRLYRENLALKVQLDALAAEVTRVRGKRAHVSLRTRASQVWAYLVTRGNAPFQKHNLSASPRTLQRWATRCRQGLSKRSEPKTRQGRPPTAEEIVELVIRMKRENMQWGQKKISQALRRMGVQVSAPTVQKILEENGLAHPAEAEPGKPTRPRPGTHCGRWISSSSVPSVGSCSRSWPLSTCTRALLTLARYDGWDVDSAWTMRTLQRP